MKIYLPNSAFLGNIDAFLYSLDLQNEDVFELSANKNWMSVHPVVLSMVAALALTVPKEGVSIEPIEAKSGHYLVAMGLYDLLGIKNATPKVIRKHEPAGRYVPLSLIKNGEQLTEFLTDMIPLLHLGASQSSTIRLIMSELIRNVLEHAKADNGAVVSAQYYKESNRIRIGIADTGIGIKRSVNQSYDAKNDVAAIKLALTPGITGTTRKLGGTEFNAGAGLFIVKSIATVNRDFFVMYSGSGLFKLLKRDPKRRISLQGNPDKDKHSEKDDLPYWKGTAVGVDISLDSTQEFEELLELVKKEFSDTVKERRKAIYRKPRYI